MTDRAASRRRMAQGRGVRDARLLAAMERVARERIVPSNARPHVFEDRPIPVAKGVVLPRSTSRPIGSRRWPARRAPTSCSVAVIVARRLLDLAVDLRDAFDDLARSARAAHDGRRIASG